MPLFSRFSYLSLQENRTKTTKNNFDLTIKKCPKKNNALRCVVLTEKPGIPENPERPSRPFEKHSHDLSRSSTVVRLWPEMIVEQRNRDVSIKHNYMKQSCLHSSLFNCIILLKLHQLSHLSHPFFVQFPQLHCCQINVIRKFFFIQTRSIFQLIYSLSNLVSSWSRSSLNARRPPISLQIHTLA